MTAGGTSTDRQVKKEQDVKEQHWEYDHLIIMSILEIRAGRPRQDLPSSLKVTCASTQGAPSNDSGAAGRGEVGADTNACIQLLRKKNSDSRPSCSEIETASSVVDRLTRATQPAPKVSAMV